MKKIALFILLVIASSHFAFGQTGRIRCIAYKEIHWYSGSWERWPDNWTSYDSDSEPTIQISTAEILQSGNIYRVRLIRDGDIMADFNVAYDANKTANVRQSWNNDYVNCYIDEDGDYIYTESVSLEQLAQNPDAWRDNTDSQMYFWFLSANHAIVVR